MTLEFHDQVTATRHATRVAARQARKQAHRTVGVVRTVDLREPAQAATVVAKRAVKHAAKRTAKATGKAAGRKARRPLGRALRVTLLAGLVGAVLALALMAFRRTRALSSTATMRGVDDVDLESGSVDDAVPVPSRDGDASGVTP